MNRLLALAAVAAALLAGTARADEADFTRKEDVIYGRKWGTALTMDVFTPAAKANGAAVVFVVSGGWVSTHDNVRPDWAREYLRRGYTVFQVVHGSQPKYTIPEAVEDMHRAVRFIRSRAEEYKIDPDRIGVTGASAGGHLSLMLGTAGGDGDPKAKDPVDRLSSRVQAVGCFFPPTDFLNYGEAGKCAIGDDILAPFAAPFDFKQFDPKKRVFERVTDADKRREIGKQISPVTHVTEKSAPSLILHGDADKLVPIQQAELMVDALKKAGVPAELIVRKGSAHGWFGIERDAVKIGDWFDKYLTKSDNKE